MTRFGLALERSTTHSRFGRHKIRSTCLPHGRNRRVGERWARENARGHPGDRGNRGGVTTKSIHDRISPLGLVMPITTTVYRILYEGVSPLEGFSNIMARPSGSERIRQ